MATSVPQLKEKLRTYREELQGVEALLAEDPDNEEFQSLKEQLSEFITMTQELLESKGAGDDAPAGDASAPTTTVGEDYAVGDEVMGKWSVDNIWYDAVVESVERDPAADRDMYRVTFVGYGNQDVLPGDSLKPRVEKQEAQPSEKTDAQGQKKKETKRQEKKRKHLEEVKEREKVHNQAKKSWTSFQSKASKKTKRFGGVRKKDSIFKSPESIDGRVGVTGSGQSLTNYETDRKALTAIPVIDKGLSLPTDEDMKQQQLDMVQQQIRMVQASFTGRG